MINASSEEDNLLDIAKLDRASRPLSVDRSKRNGQVVKSQINIHLFDGLADLTSGAAKPRTGHTSGLSPRDTI